MESRITAKGQATFPKAVRDYLHLEAGDRVKFFFHPDGSVAILPKIPTSALRGILAGKVNKPATLDDMEEAIKLGATGKLAAEKR